MAESGMGSQVWQEVCRGLMGHWEEQSWTGQDDRPLPLIQRYYVCWYLKRLMQSGRDAHAL